MFSSFTALVSTSLLILSLIPIFTSFLPIFIFVSVVLSFRPKYFPQLSQS